MIKLLLKIFLWILDLLDKEVSNLNPPESGIETNTDSGKKKVISSYHSERLEIYELWSGNEVVLRCAGDHRVFLPGLIEKHVKDLEKGDHLLGEFNIVPITKVTRLRMKQRMFDLGVDSPDQRYYTNGILSHNSITTAIYIAWYLCFNTDRNVMLLSRDSSTVKELMDKIKVIIKNLPFYIRPGIVVNNVMSMAFDNGCKLVAQTTTQDSGASFTIHLLYIDEFALISSSFLNEFYRTVYPTISSSDISRIILTSTPRGLNKFYEIYSKAVYGQNYYNPIRIDWWQVPGRDDAWKKAQIMDLGSVEDFNQEYGNQFLSGANILLKPDQLRKTKANEVEFVFKQIPAFDDLELPYGPLLDAKGKELSAPRLTWHPKFELERCKDQHRRFVITVDLASGSEGDFTVFNIFELTMLSMKSIKKLKLFTEEKDFFKFMQVGLFRSNSTKIPEASVLFYHLVVDLFDKENVKSTLELNHRGEEFIFRLSQLYGKYNDFEEDYTFTKYRRSISNETLYPGVNLTYKLKERAASNMSQAIKMNQIVIFEKTTIEEVISLGVKKGVVVSQIGNDDCAMTVMHMGLHMDTLDAQEFVDEWLEINGDNPTYRKRIEKMEEMLGIEDETGDEMADLYL